ncbi:MAG: metalloprotease TldD, partial [Gammaproteobacteria bacterium]|nr:metalloprotease TldD [Gammaproteobacteria bacterium]
MSDTVAVSDSVPADPLDLARDLILRPSGLDDRRLDRVFGEVLTHSVDFADLYFQLSHQESWSLEDGMVKDGTASIEQGVGVRALAGEKTGFAYSDEIVLPALTEASRAARAIAVHGGERRIGAWQARSGHRLYLSADPALDLETSEKVAWLERVDREARRLDPRVVHVSASLVAVHEVVLIATSDGELAADVRPLVRFNVSVLVEQSGRREQGYAG